MITKKLNGIRAKVFKKEVEKVRDEVLGKKEATSLKRLFSRSPQGRLTSTIILVSLVLSACDYFPPTEKTVTETLVKPTISETMPATETAMVDETPWIELTPTATETATETASPTATETAEPTATETTEPTPTATVEVDELGIRVEFAKGEYMTKEELKASVDWFYGLSDTELNNITKESLWSNAFWPGDSRPRDPIDNTKVIRDYEDLGWYFTETMRDIENSFSERNMFNGIYLGTTMIIGDKNLMYISAVGTKDWLGNRFVIYGNTGMLNFDYSGFNMAIRENHAINYGEAKIISPSEATFELLNNHLRDVVNIELREDIKIVSNVRPGTSAEFLLQMTGDNELMDLIDKQRQGLTNSSARELIDSNLMIVDNKLPLAFKLEIFYKFVPYMHMTVPKHE